jgi:hypothetical protein
MITVCRLNRATLAAQGELSAHGFWLQGNRLLRTDVCLIACPPPSCLLALGFFTHGDMGTLGRIAGFEVGNIYIPTHLGTLFRIKSLLPKRLLSLLGEAFQGRSSLRDVVRHEYAHAVAHWYPRLIQRSVRFKEVFGGDYWAKTHSRSEQEEFVSSYASEKPMEDFAETFMVFLRHKGVLPERFNFPMIKQKWRFIKELGQRIGNGHIAW